MIKFTLFLWFLFLFASTLSAQDSTLVRIRVDVDSAVIQINENVIIEDSYGNVLLKNSWFILNLPLDTYNIKISSGFYNPIDSTIILVKDEIITFDIRFIEVNYEDTAKYFKEIPELIEVVKLVLNSEPDSSNIVIDKEKIDETTPAEIYVRPGEYSFIVDKDGFNSLGFSIKIESERPISALFKLSDLKPSLITADSLGLSYMNKLPQLNIRSAEKVKVKYKALTESFAIFPLAQGIFARLVVDKSQHKTTNGLIIAGVSLTLGSYLLGKILYKKKRKYIIEENERRIEGNILVENNNQTVEKAIREENTNRLRDWQKKNRQRGKVEIDSLEVNQ